MCCVCGLCGCVFVCVFCVCVDFLVVYCILRVGRYPQCKLLNLFQVNCFIQRQYHECPYIENVFFVISNVQYSTFFACIYI